MSTLLKTKEVQTVGQLHNMFLLDIPNSFLDVEVSNMVQWSGSYDTMIQTNAYVLYRYLCLSCILISQTRVASAKTTDMSQSLHFHVPLSYHPNVLLSLACCLSCSLSSAVLAPFYGKPSETLAKTHTYTNTGTIWVILCSYQAYHPYFIQLKQIQCKALTCSFNHSKVRHV